jgi:hypothetical protein
MSLIRDLQITVVTVRDYFIPTSLARIKKSHTVVQHSGG